MITPTHSNLPAPVDLTAVKIERNIPLPPPRLMRSSGLSALLKRMMLGDSFFLPDTRDPYLDRMRSAALYNTARYVGIRVTVRRQPNGYRVWRVK